MKDRENVQAVVAESQKSIRIEKVVVDKKIESLSMEKKEDGMHRRQLGVTRYTVDI